MNLQEIMNYRTRCIICGRQLKTVVSGDKYLQTSYNKRGLKISSRHSKGIMILFDHENNYHKNNKNYSIYKKPIRIQRECPTCCDTADFIHKKMVKPLPNKLIIMKSRTIGYSTFHHYETTFQNMKSNRCLYTFIIWGDSEGNYVIRPALEVLKIFDQEAFWHMTTDFSEGHTTFHHAKFSDNIDNLLTLNLPATNMSGTITKDEFVRKFKLYTLFS